MLEQWAKQRKFFAVNLPRRRQNRHLICLISNSRLSLLLQILMTEKDKAKLVSTEKRKAADQETEPLKDLKKVRNLMQMK